MKVTELFEAQGAPGQGGKLKGGAYYAPTYLADKGQIRGSVQDWLDAMGASPEDVKEAISRVKASTLFTRDLPAAGLTYVSKPASEKRGTLTFEVTRTWVNNGKISKGKTGYMVYANGVLRSTSTDPAADSHMTPLKTPKPRLKAGDPVASVTMTMMATLEELLAKWKKSSERMKKQAAQLN